MCSVAYQTGLSPLLVWHMFSVPCRAHWHTERPRQPRAVSVGASIVPTLAPVFAMPCSWSQMPTDTHAHARRFISRAAPVNAYV